MVFGLLLFGIGSLLFIPSEHIMSFPAFLFSLFVLGCGLVFLETAANPYVTNLGEPSTAASRLNLSQSFNGLGCLLAPMIGAAFLFTDDGGSVAIPYGVMGVFVLIVAIGFTQVKLPEITPAADDNAPSGEQGVMAIWGKATFTFGIIALFCYEIAEISINSMFINYVSDGIGWLTPMEAAKVLSMGGLLLFLFGRLIGSFVMRVVKAQTVLLTCAVFTVAGSLLVTFDLGLLSKVGLFACFAFESIMFPTIFALSLRGLGANTKRASSFLMMTPIGGAVGTFLMALTADATSMSTAFIVPAIAYAVVLAYAIASRK